MGRPLKKSFFGSPATGGKQLVLSHVWLEGSTAAETGFWIVRQVGTGRYQVTNGTKVGVVKLVDAMPDAPGEGVIIVTPFGASQVEYASKIFNRTVKTFDGNSYMWSADAATEEGHADFTFETWEEAEAEEITVTAEAGEGFVGYVNETAGAISGSIAGFDVVSIYDTTESNLLLAGDQSAKATVTVSIAGGADVVLTLDAYDAEGGATAFVGTTLFGFADGQTYTIDGITSTAV